LSRVKRDTAILVLVAILLGVFAWQAFPVQQKTHLGLDLQGGLSVILQAQPTATNPLDSNKMDQAVKIIQDRVNKLGAAEPEIQRQGADKISVQLPGINNPDQALQIIGKTAVLEFFDVKDFGTAYTAEADALKAAGVASADKLPAGTEIIHWPSTADSASGTDQWFVVKTTPPVTGGMLKSAAVGYDQNNRPKVNMTFNSEGADAFDAITKKMAQTGSITGTVQRLAIVLDGEVKSAPTVKEEISGGDAEITGSFTMDDVKALVVVLQTGALPVTLQPVSQNSIGATLGKSALDQALLAGFIGLALVVVFMVAYYRLLGVVASVALGIYGILFIGILNAIGVTMTLPGIAGMVLTLGMAVDANVLIFARMRDEVGAGKTIGAATSAGFKKAFRAVFDCNMTTIITAIILFWAATGGIKGFALTLGIGVALSMFTAVLVSRSMLSLLSGWRPFRNRRLLGLHVDATKRWKIYPFMRYRWWFLGTISAVTIFAIITIFVLGLNFGIDFKGGTRMEVGLTQTATVDQVRSLVSAQGVKEPVVQEITGATGTQSFLITFRADSTEQENTLTKQVLAALDSKYGAKAETSSTESVQGSFSKATTNRAFIACAIAIIAIIGYLTFRFEFKFAIPAIVALFHDVGLTLGIYAATGRLVTTATVAAILTILGYSVHDTIIVYDRIRENTLLMKRETYGEMVDLSIRQTLNRSINTTVAILLPLLAILIFGGPTLKDFAFALTIGVLTGTYSSFFVASPLVVLWKSREARYRKRLALAGAGGGSIVVNDASGDMAAPALATSSATSSARARPNSGAKPKPKRGGAPSKSGASSKAKKGKTTSKRPPGK
jgi:SecD/SecF fusion protein